MNSPARSIALAIGDPHGIGPEIAVKAAYAMAGNPQLNIVLVGDGHVIRYYAGRHASDAKLISIDDARPTEQPSIRISEVSSLPQSLFAPGRIDAAAGKATVDYVDAAVQLVRRGVADAIIGCPHNEAAVNAAGIPFSGYPGLIARLTNTDENKVFMMLVGGGLRFFMPRFMRGYIKRWRAFRQL